MGYRVISNEAGWHREVARLHVANIDQGFLQSLGTPVLSLLYKALSRSKRGILILAFREDELVGFAAGTDNMKDLYIQLLKYPLSSFSIVCHLLLKPKAMWKVVEILLYSSRKERNAIWPNAELLSFCVEKDCRGSGIAERMFQEFSNSFSNMDIRSFTIVVGENLEQAHRFYSRMGADPKGETEVHADQRSVIYVQKI